MARYHAMLDRYHTAFSQFRINDIVKNVHEFFWGDYCDWYLEAFKSELGREIDREKARQTVCLAVHVLEGVLKALHPVMPFITDEIWHFVLRRGTDESISTSSMPVSDPVWKPQNAAAFSMVQNTIAENRSIRAEFNVPHDMLARVIIKASSAENRDILEANSHIIQTMTKCAIELSDALERPRHAASSVVDGNELFICLEGLISFEKEKLRLQKEISKVSSYLQTLEKKLSNQGFVANAPADVVEKEQIKLDEARSLARKLQSNLEVLDN
jgi:valyl-tRNA synthetase